MELKDITEDNIEDIADSPAIMSRGRSYFLEGRVINLRITNKNIIAIVQGCVHMSTEKQVERLPVRTVFVKRDFIEPSTIF